MLDSRATAEVFDEKPDHGDRVPRVFAGGAASLTVAGQRAGDEIMEYICQENNQYGIAQGFQ